MDVSHCHHRTSNSTGPLQHLGVDVLLIAVTMVAALSGIVSSTVRSQPERAPTTITTLASEPTSPLMRVPLNEATVSELGLLPAVGPAMADRIIEYRTVHQQFGSWTDLGRVSGMGPATVQTIQPWCVIEPAIETIANFEMSAPVVAQRSAD